MDRPLSQETQSKIRELCESIAQRDQLGDDVQEELRGHIEDKLIAYLEGNETLTEEDALILAREHVGSIAELKAGLQAAHPGRVVEDLVRRIAIIATVSYSVQFVVTAILHAVYGNPFALYLVGDSNPAALTIDTMVASGAIVVAVVAGIMLVLRLKEVTTSARRPQRRSTALLVACAVVAAILSAFMPAWSRGVSESLATYHHIWQFGFHISIAAASCFTWICWIDHAPRTRTTLIAGVVAWLFVALLQPYATGLVSLVGWWTIGSAEMEAFIGALVTGTDAPVFSISRIATFQFGINGMIYNAIAATVAFLLYRLLFYPKRSVTVVVLAMLVFSVVSFDKPGGDPDFLGGSQFGIEWGRPQLSPAHPKVHVIRSTM